jgi:G3E family GTPase
VVVDSERWEELYEEIPFLLTAQIERADIVFINKIDSVDADELKHIEAEIKDFNRESPLIKAAASRDNLDKVWEEVIINA